MFHYICLSFEENESFTFRNLLHTFYPKISRNSYYINVIAGSSDEKN